MIRPVEIIMTKQNKIDDKFKERIKKRLEVTFQEQDRLFDSWLNSLPQATLPSIDNLFIGPIDTNEKTTIYWNICSKVA